MFKSSKHKNKDKSKDKKGSSKKDKGEQGSKGAAAGQKEYRESSDSDSSSIGSVKEKKSSSIFTSFSWKSNSGKQQREQQEAESKRSSAKGDFGKGKKGSDSVVKGNQDQEEPSATNSEPHTGNNNTRNHNRTMSGMSGDENNWQFSQVFGDKGLVDDVTEADIISTVEFDHTGNYLATGDKGGRIVLFEKTGQTGEKGSGEYTFYTEFQSHEPEFDYLKSLEIEEKINKIKWVKPQNSSHFLLSTNDKTVKLWKVYDKDIRAVSSCNLEDENGERRDPQTINTLRVPNLNHVETVVAAVPKRVYANAHAYHINSISINSDGETFLSADDLRINLWNLGVNDESFNIVDIKPANMEELTEVITAAEFHPIHCNHFMYSSSKGTIKLADMRSSALCDGHAKMFEEEEDVNSPSNKSFFSEIISSISDVRFSNDGRYIMSRDYLTVKLWDLNMERRPVKTFHIHEYLRSKLCDLYENDCIFDKFECTWSGDDKYVMTGSYHNMFNIYNRETGNECLLEACPPIKKTPSRMFSSVQSGGKGGSSGNGSGLLSNRRKKEDINVDTIDFNKKSVSPPFEDNWSSDEE
eukprot:Nk52_evm12s148 gene=Nk52_evmTU12s148